MSLQVRLKVSCLELGCSQTARQNSAEFTVFVALTAADAMTKMITTTAAAAFQMTRIVNRRHEKLRT